MEPSKWGHSSSPTVWGCPNCTLKALSYNHDTPGHFCRGFRGLYLIMIPEGMRAEHKAIEREDYIRDDIVQYDSESRPVMAVLTKRDDGEDCTVYAPLAKGVTDGVL